MIAIDLHASRRGRQQKIFYEKIVTAQFWLCKKTLDWTEWWKLYSEYTTTNNFASFKCDSRFYFWLQHERLYVGCAWLECKLGNGGARIDDTRWQTTCTCFLLDANVEMRTAET